MRLMFEPFRRMTDVRGRSRRAAFWSFALLSAGLGTAASFFDAFIRGRPGVASIVTLAGLAWPMGAAAVRRLHDSGRAGRLLLLVLAPGVGVLALGVLLALPGSQGPNRYGADPRGVAKSKGPPDASGGPR